MCFFFKGKVRSRNENKTPCLSASICKHETVDKCYLVLTMNVTAKFVVTSVTTKLAVTAVMTKLVVLAYFRNLAWGTCDGWHG